MMTPERLLAFFDAWNAHDVEAIVGCFTPDGAYHASIGPDDEGTTFTGFAELRRGVAAFLRTYGDVRYTDLVVGMCGSDRAFASWTFHGTSPAGQPVTYRGVDLFVFEGDRIALKDAYRKERSGPIGG
jgi:ketosteroid isomerase-like protein